MQTETARFYSLNWVVSDPVYMQSEDPPKSALKNRKTGEYVRGSDGTFLKKEPNKLILSVQTKDGRIYRENIMSYFKDIFPRKNVTKSVRTKLEVAFRSCVFEIRISPSNGDVFIFGIYDAIREALR